MLFSSPEAKDVHIDMSDLTRDPGITVPSLPAVDIENRCQALEMLL